MSKTSKQGPRDLPELLTATQSILDKGIRALDRRTEALIARLDEETAPAKKSKKPRKPKKPDVALNSHLAWLLERVAKLGDSLRQLEKHDRGMTKTPEQRYQLVLAYLRDLDNERRSNVKQYLAELDAGARSILS